MLLTKLTSPFALRENHSGMETNLRNSFLPSLDDRCVRTIVVWKPILALFARIMESTLRENHSGMETLPSLVHKHIRYVLLRENHSGMET